MKTYSTTVEPELNGFGCKAAILGNGQQKPETALVDPASVHDGLKLFDRWTGWNWVWDTKRNKWNKPPKDARTGRSGDSTDRTKWCNFNEAIEAQRNGVVDGIGFCLGEEDGGVNFAGVDLDDCRDPETGKLTELAQDVITGFDSYTEVSPSGTGIKIFLIGKLPDGAKCKNSDGTVEFYSSGRYFTLTGQHIPDTPKSVEQRQKELEWHHKKLIGQEPKQQQAPPPAEPSGAEFHQVALDDMMRLAVKNENDGSTRLLLCGKIAVEYDLSDKTAVATWRKYATLRRFPADWTDDDFLRRLRDAEKKAKRGAKCSQGPSGDWPEPEPFDSEKLPLCPVDVFPTVIADWILATAEATQTPADMAALQALTVCSAAIAGKSDCQVVPGYFEPTNIFTATMMPPGNRKSSVYAAAVKPLLAYEKELCEGSKFDVSIAASERRVYEKKLASLEKQAAGGGDKASAAMQELRDVVTWLEENAERALPQIVIDDSTVEDLVITMHRQNGVIASLSAEGGCFDIMAGRYGDKPNFDVYLKGHAGDSLKQGRVSREPIHIMNPRLTCGYCLQPYHFEKLSAKEDLRGRGLLARFLYCIPRSYIGGRTCDSIPVSDNINRGYSDTVGVLCKMGDGDFRLSEDSVVSYREWFREVEPRLKPDGDLAFDVAWSSKLVGATIRIAAILEAIRICSQWNAERVVRAETFEAAVKFARYLIPHAQRAMWLLAGSGSEEFGAEDVLRRIRKWKTGIPGLASFTARELHQRARKTYTREQLKDYLDCLVERGWLREVEGSRKASNCYLIHPEL